jgi:hypothetical protein
VSTAGQAESGTHTLQRQPKVRCNSRLMFKWASVEFVFSDPNNATAPIAVMVLSAKRMS